MATLASADPYAGASYRNMVDHLPGPFSAGALDDPLPISETGRISATGFREALVVLAPRAALADEALQVSATLDPDGANTDVSPPLEFPRFSDAGAFLPLYRPLDPFTLQLKAQRIAGDGTATPIDANALDATFEARLIQGVLGRTIFALGAEKARIRRVAREIGAMRLLSQARLDALDRLGAGLAVPRFVDEIGYDAARKEIVTTALPPDKPEADADYARRLRIYHPWRVPNRSTLLDLLNGPGADGDPNQGLLAGVGITRRFGVLEDDNEFAVAVHLISAGPDQPRLSFFEHVRATRLVWPADDPAANAVHAARYLPTRQKADEIVLRASLRQSFTFAASHAIAPMLATCLDRVGRCLRALGVATPIAVTRAQDSAGGSRFELGLGVEVEVIPTADVDAARNALVDVNRIPAADAEVEGLLRTMAPKTAAEEPEASWLFRACGLRTVHLLASGRLYVSHLPTFGLVMTAATNAAPNAVQSLSADYNAPGDPGGNVVLVTALADAAGRWTAGGGPAYTVLSRADSEAAWAGLVEPAGPAASALQNAGLRAVTSPGAAQSGLLALPPALVATIALDPTQANAILSNQPQASADLANLVELLRDEGISSALPLVTGAGQVLLALGVIGLPEVGTNLSDRRSTGFRWYAVPLQGPAPEVRPIGSRTTFRAAAPGLSAVVVIGYARRGLTDPYEYRVSLPDDALLSIGQYEFLMNVLGYVYPLGIEINTYSIRHSHVDLDGDGVAEALPPRISRTYRQFRRPRLRGEASVTLQSPDTA